MKHGVAVVAVAASAALLINEPGIAQQPTTLLVQTTAVPELRAWDRYVLQATQEGALRVENVVRDRDTSQLIERFSQSHRGVPIWGAEIVRSSDRGVTEWVFGSLAPQLTIATEPGLTIEMARTRVLDVAGAESSLLRQPTLVVASVPTAGYRLAYTAAVRRHSRVFRTFIDAATGAELLRYSLIHTQAAVGTGVGVLGDRKKLSVLRQGGIFVASDQQRPPALTTFDMRGEVNRALHVLDGGALFASDLAADTDNDWTDAAAVDAHAYIGWTYDYFFKRHGRQGLDDRNRPIVSLINGVSQEGALELPPELLDFAVNAFWCGECGPDGVGLMYFGNGIPSKYAFAGQTVAPIAGSLDVVAHELTHAVTNASSDLIYLDESGALNEAFSDIMGTAVEFFHQPTGAFRGQADFIIGEDTFRSYYGDLHGVRSLSNPGVFGNPDHYSLRYTGSEDDGGVHVNSTIPSHAFYLAVMGGTNRTSRLTVKGVGLANMAQIEKAFYRAFVYMLPASATFSMARAATIQAARDLYGDGSAPEVSITQAWTAVGVF
jgi:Zn-dependent metalloprotease